MLRQRFWQVFFFSPAQVHSTDTIVWYPASLCVLKVDDSKDRVGEAGYQTTDTTVKSAVSMDKWGFTAFISKRR